MQTNQSAAEPMIYRDKEYKCGIDVTLAVVGEKYKAPIFWHQAQVVMRFSELQRQFSNTTRRMPTQQQRELEADGLVHGEVFPQVPPKVEYSLPVKERSIYPILEKMCEWGQGFLRD